METVAGARNCRGCTSNINTRFQCACKNVTPTTRVPVLRGGCVAARRVYYEVRVSAVPDRDRYAAWQVPVARTCLGVAVALQAIQDKDLSMA